MDSKKYALIVAGGKGVRMQHTHPKPFLELCGMPILLHTIHAFLKYSKDIEIILVLAEQHRNIWNSICKKYPIESPICIQPGGSTRCQSVKNGLEAITHNGLVAIHDAVRPLVHPDTIATSFSMAALHGTAVATVPCKDAIRKITYNGSKAADRSRYHLVQTPQTFDTQLIQAAYTKIFDTNATDDASIAEQAGHTIHTFAGRYDNIKITTPEDLSIAKTLLLNYNKE